MSAAPPEPKRATESDVDAVIEKIDAALPKVYQRVEESKKAGRSPSGNFSREAVQRTREAFAEMGEDSLLTGSGEDIRLRDDLATPAAGNRRPKQKLYYRRPSA